MLIFAVLLFAAVLISCKARETVLSTSGLFLLCGLVIGKWFLHGLPVPGREFLYRLSEVALFATLFSDGMKVTRADVRAYGGAVSRVLLVGMALTIGLAAVAARYVGGFAWAEALLIGAILAPTDPVFVAAIFDTEAVPERTKRILNLESGLNDGLALPIVLLLLSTAYHTGSSPLKILWELLFGVAIGVAVPWAAIKLEQTRLFGAAGLYESLNAVAIGVLIYALCMEAGANPFLAAFCGGACVAATRREVVEAFHRFGDLLTELLKLATLLIFAARAAEIVLHRQPWRIVAVAFAAAFVARFAAVPVSLWRSGLPRAEIGTLAYFGPKGFASVVYAIMVLNMAQGQGRSLEVATVCGLAVTLSIAVYSSTDVLVGQWYERRAGNSREVKEGSAA